MSISREHLRSQGAKRIIELIPLESGGRVGRISGKGASAPSHTGDPCPILDTRLRKMGKYDGCVDPLGRPDKLFRDRRAGKLLSRVRLGLFYPGTYWFLTLTTSRHSPPLEQSWKKFREFLVYRYPDCSWVYCITAEGLGVIHMIIRTPKGTERLNKVMIETSWNKIHNAFINLKKVTDKNGIAEYLADQRHKSNISAEMFNQPSLIRYRTGRGWLPVGFMKAFGRAWHNLRNVPPSMKTHVIQEWMVEIEENPKNMQLVPYVDHKGILQRKNYDKTDS